MGDIVQKAKNYIKNKGASIHIGNIDDSIVVPGGMFASGNIKVQVPYDAPANENPKSYDVLYSDGVVYEWKSEKIQSPLTQNSPLGVDYLYINSSRGFFAEDQIIINPFGPTRETGVVGYAAQETKIYLAEKTIQNHYIGETVIKV